jgi:uncharacterized membrane protein
MKADKILGAAMFAAIVTVASCGGGATNPQPPGNVKEAEKIVAEGRASGPMPDGAFKAGITVNDPPTKMRPGQKSVLTVKVKNLGTAPWPAHGRLNDGFYQVNLGDNWFDSKDKRLVNHTYVRSGLPNDVKPGDEVQVQLTITAPEARGDYSIQIDLVQEMVAWFAEKGSSAPKFKVTVGD